MATNSTDMQIKKNTVVSLTYELVDVDGTLIEKTDAPVSYLHGGHDGIFARVQQALEGKRAGFECRVQLAPEEGFGAYEPSLVRTESRALFPAAVEVGMQFEGSSEASGERHVYTVTGIDGDKVTVDGNHALAGRSLVFSCTVTNVRTASRDELAHGHVHGAGGHHH
ncbi:MAG TPA: peptidylprolyl isomerase [Burkholderiales bacterium]|nr:peptidylprolyl isomerase [Burkholderiales bacterium]